MQTNYFQFITGCKHSKTPQKSTPGDYFLFYLNFVFCPSYLQHPSHLSLSKEQYCIASLVWFLYANSAFLLIGSYASVIRICFKPHKLSIFEYCSIGIDLFIFLLYFFKLKHGLWKSKDVYSFKKQES